MKRLILTTSDSGAGNIGAAGLADFTVTLGQRLVSSPPLSKAQLAGYFVARATEVEGPFWQYHSPDWRIEKSGGKDLGLVDFCARYDEIELWIDPDPNAQLNLIWLLDFLRAHESLATQVRLVHADFSISERCPDDLAKWQPARVNVTRDHLETASVAWKAWREPAPPAWFELLALDLSPLPRLKWAVAELLDELPGQKTGLSATELWMLERTSARQDQTGRYL